MKINFLSRSAIMIAVILLSSCQKEINTNQRNQKFSETNSAVNVNEHSKKIYVNSVSELYSAINNPQNSGGTIVLSPGTYKLASNYPKAGRLELLNNMSLAGKEGEPGAVVIDVTNLPITSLILPPTQTLPSIRTGAIRIGDGSNSLEWITFQNDPSHTIRSLVQTDIVTTPFAKVRIAHCILKGSSIGINIINRDAIANNRVVDAEIENNEIMNNTVLQFGSGIQIQNSNGVYDAQINVTLRENFVHGNKAGMLAFNASSGNCSIRIKSYTDDIDGNGLGLMFNGGFIESASTPALNNSLKFDGYATTIHNNNGIPSPTFLYPAGGIYAAAGESFPPFAPPGTSHHNQLDISFHGCSIENNTGNAQINAYGGHSFYPSTIPVGTYNITNIYLYGISSKATVNAVNSFPSEPAGTNTVTVYR